MEEEEGAIRKRKKRKKRRERGRFRRREAEEEEEKGEVTTPARADRISTISRLVARPIRLSH